MGKRHQQLLKEEQQEFFFFFYKGLHLWLIAFLLLRLLLSTHRGLEDKLNTH